MGHGTRIVRECHVQKCLDIALERFLREFVDYLSHHPPRNEHQGVLIVDDFDLSLLAEVTGRDEDPKPATPEARDDPGDLIRADGR